jgi:hypothetical protein
VNSASLREAPPILALPPRGQERRRVRNRLRNWPQPSVYVSVARRSRPNVVASDVAQAFRLWAFRSQAGALLPALVRKTSLFHPPQRRRSARCRGTASLSCPIAPFAPIAILCRGSVPARESGRRPKQNPPAADRDWEFAVPGSVCRPVQPPMNSRRAPASTLRLLFPRSWIPFRSLNSSDTPANHRQSNGLIETTPE